MDPRIETWVGAYMKAWDSRRPEDIGPLFTEQAEYRSYPWATPVRGWASIVELWLSSPDRAGDHSFSWSLLDHHADRYYVNGHTKYADGRTFENLWIVQLDPSGRAASFTEWYMESASKALGPNG